MKIQPLSARRLLVPATIIVALAAAGLLLFDVLRHSREAPPPSRPAAQHAADPLPPSLAPVVTQTLQASSGAAYHAVAMPSSPSSAPVSFEAPNAAHAFTTRFGPRGLTIHPEGLAERPLALRLDGYGSGDTSAPIEMQAWSADGLRVERASADPSRPLVEWYVNGRLGLEQGFTVSSPPDGRGDSLVLHMAVSDGWTARAAVDAILLEDDNGTERLRYDRLSVLDAAGTLLPAWMSAEQGGITVRVATAGAQYPVTIDPMISQQAQLLAPDGLANDQFGYSVAVDGDTVAIGANFDDLTQGNQGSVYVFMRSGTTWTLQQQLTANPVVGSGEFGTSVAVSGDTILVGGFRSSAAYVFVRSGGTWTQQAQLTVTDAFNNPRFGSIVALSGNTAVVSAHGDDLATSGAGQVIDAGSAYVFVRSGTTWTRQAKLVAGDPQQSDLFGEALAVDGDTIVVGAGQDFANRPGKAYVFVRTGTAWAQQQKLTASDGATSDLFGLSVAVKGNTAVIGSASDDVTFVNQGSAYVFVRSGTTWSQQTKLTASNAAASAQFGNSVAMDGDTVAVGAAWLNSERGTAYLFVRSGTSWSQQTPLLASDGAVAHRFGSSIAISGATTVVGASFYDAGAVANKGAAYVFTLSPGSAPTISTVAALARQQGSSPTVTQIATVNDDDESSNGLTITASAPAGIRSLASATPMA